MGALINDALCLVDEHLHGELTDNIFYSMEAFLGCLEILALAHFGDRADEVVEDDLLLDAVLLEADRDYFRYLEKILLIAGINYHLLEEGEQLIRILVF